MRNIRLFFVDKSTFFSKEPSLCRSLQLIQSSVISLHPADVLHIRRHVWSRPAFEFSPVDAATATQRNRHPAHEEVDGVTGNDRIERNTGIMTRKKIGISSRTLRMMYVLMASTLKKYIEATGGKLRLDIEMRDGSHYGFSV